MSPRLCISRVNGCYLFHQKNMFPLSYWLCHYDFESVSVSKKIFFFKSVIRSMRSLPWDCDWVTMSRVTFGDQMLRMKWRRRRNCVTVSQVRWSIKCTRPWAAASQAFKEIILLHFFLNLSQVFALRHHCKHQLMLDRVNWPGIGEGG